MTNHDNYDKHTLKALEGIHTELKNLNKLLAVLCMTISDKKDEDEEIDDGK